MGLFGKPKDEAYRVHVSFAKEPNLENEILAPFFDACKKNGIKLVSEPSFENAEDQVWVRFTFTDGFFGVFTWFPDHNKGWVDTYRKLDSSITNEMFTEAVKEWLQALNDSNLNVTYQAEKEVKKYKYAEWPEALPARRSFM